MRLDWDLLGKWDIIFGVLTGMILVFSGVRWIARKTRSTQVATFVAWAIIGQEDEEALISTMSDIVKLLMAGVIWAVIGAVTAVFFMVIVIVVNFAMGVQVMGVASGIVQIAVLGALFGAVVRVLIWPAVTILRKNWQSRRDAYETRREEFSRQKQRIESKIKRRRGND